MGGGSGEGWLQQATSPRHKMPKDTPPSPAQPHPHSGGLERATEFTGNGEETQHILLCGPKKQSGNGDTQGPRGGLRNEQEQPKQGGEKACRWSALGGLNLITECGCSSDVYTEA